MAIVDRFRAVFDRPIDSNGQDYTPLSGPQDDDSNCDPTLEDDDTLAQSPAQTPFSWLEYFVFLLLGIAMLWAWNMYLAAAPYFAKRFFHSEWILDHFQSSIISVGTITNLLSMLLLANLQASASYTKRVVGALSINIVAFTLLALSTTWFRDVSPGTYLGFVLVSVFCTSIATGLVQNGAFALAAGFGHPSYTQAIMTGQGIAGVLPPIAQIITVLAVPPPVHDGMGARGHGPAVPGGPPHGPPKESSTSAFIYFLTATIISILAILAFIPLIRRHNNLASNNLSASITSFDLAARANRTVVPLTTLYKKLYWFASAVFLCFAVTMFFPVFTAQIVSTQNPATRARLFEPPTFIPLAFLFWNMGDLGGRLATILPFSLSHRPYLLLVLAVSRIIFLPLYLLCNIHNRGAFAGNGGVWGDLFYLVIVQFGFGLTNGWLGSSCMMGAGTWVNEGEGEAAGAFMGLNLVAGLTVGSLASFGAGGKR